MSDAEDSDMRMVPGSPHCVPDPVAPLEDVDTLRADREALHGRVATDAIDLETLARVRDEFLATTSHDLKAPLTSILGSAQFIERPLAASSPDVHRAVRWARIIQDRARTMTLLINDLLDASRLQTGAFSLRLAPCDLTVCAATATRRLVPDLQARVHVTGTPPPVCGYWDRQRIEQVLSNLLDNVLKYSPNGEDVSLVVEMRAVEVEVSVSDRGIGIPPGELPRIFGRFYRAADVTAGDVPGTCLGLYICERIVTAHGGRLWAEPVGPGTGSTFRFVLPIRPSAVATTAHPKVQAK